MRFSEAGSCSAVGGHHDDFDYLYSLPVGEDGLRRVRPRILHLPRGFRWTWAGQRFLACGGAGSIDRQWRTPGVSWWAEERIIESDVERCIGDGPADVLVSHDAPPEAPVVSGGLPWEIPPKVSAAAATSRRHLGAVVEAVRPRLVIHGHWHQHHISEMRSLADPKPAWLIIGLSEDESRWGNLAVLKPARLVDNVRDAISVVG